MLGGSCGKCSSEWPQQAPLTDGDEDEGGGDGGGDVPGQAESATDNASADDDSSNI